MKNSAIYLIILFAVILSGCTKTHSVRYNSDWANSPDGVWAGPELWANRLQDWKVENGKLVCINSKPMRTVHLTTRRASGAKGNINTSVHITINRGSSYTSESAAGFLIGAGRNLDYRAASLIHHSYGKQAGLFVGLDATGNLFIRDFEKENGYLEYNTNNNSSWDKAYLIMTVKPEKDYYSIKVTAVDPVTNLIIDRLELDNIEPERIEGNIALVSHSGYSSDSDTSFSFENWNVSGSNIH